MAEVLDIVVVGGGINGAGIARDAAGRGLSVLLCEKSDLASATSSASTKLIHGGLRYLEHFEFRLVAEALAEREIMLRIAGHLTWPTRFVAPHVPELRPRWMIRIGLFLYDHLARRSLLPVAVSGAVAAVGGSLLALSLPEEQLRVLFAGFIAIAGISMLWPLAAPNRTITAGPRGPGTNV